MSLPPTDHRDAAGSDASPTEPVPAFVPPADEAAPSAPGTPAPSVPPAPSGPPPSFLPPALAFAAVEPGPGARPGEGFTVPTARAGRMSGRGASGGSSTILNIALGAAILVGAVGVAFAVGRATSPAASGGSTPIANQGLPGARGNGNANGGTNGNGNGNANGNGNGNANGGGLPNASFDLNGNGGVPGDRDGDFGRGVGRDGLAGLGLTGTVTEVTADHVTIQTDRGLTVTVGIDGTTTYHQQAPAAPSDVKTGSTVQVQLGTGGVRQQQDANGNITLGTAGDITVVP